MEAFIKIFALFTALFGLFFSGSGAQAQFEAGEGIGSAQAGENLSSLLGVLDEAEVANLGVPCQGVLVAQSPLEALTCLSRSVINIFALPQQRHAYGLLFESRFSNHFNWIYLEDALKPEQTDLDPIEEQEAFPAFADLAGAPNCPAFTDDTPLLPTTRRALYLATPEGKRDLSPPLHIPPSLEHTLLKQALDLADPVGPLQETACTSLRSALSRALFQSLLGHGRLQAAADLADAPFMPRRYARQVAGARQDRDAQETLKQEALALLFDAQAALQDPGAAIQEVSAILNEIERQFDIDFLMGLIWASNSDGFAALELDTAFIGAVARLLSQDAKLLQQGYGPEETRFFYTEFFGALATKGAFDLLKGLDLLVPASMATNHQLALDARPIAREDPTRFSSNQEVLALLIREGQQEALASLWAEVETPQRQDAVLFAYDQEQEEIGAFLYAQLEEGDVSLDFLIRLSLYMAAWMLRLEGGDA